MDPMVMVYTTTPSEESAKKIGKKLLEEKLIGCYNTFKIQSGYWWKGKIESSDEWGLLMKSTLSKYKEIQSRIKELHDYDVPLIAGWIVPLINEEYYNWLKDATR